VNASDGREADMAKRTKDLREERREARRVDVAEYARACAGTDADLDRPLERAAVEFLLQSRRKRRRSS